MDYFKKQSGTRNATILMILAGALNTILGYLSIIIPDYFQLLVGTSMIVFGVVSFCTSLVIWFQKPWAMKIITVVGVAVCVNLIVFGYYLMIILFAPIFVVARNQLRQVIEKNEWHKG
ncbi:hypothetical protein EU527_03170 [Candidatus Thorarchaeota archaeon]|nr:MAG: hypothetical protein EU527_03170 [Candidatus Thorarchaeota archaeon]